MLKIITILFIATLAITGCDNHEFTQFFRNPYIVEVGELDTLKAGQWHEFKTNAKALNREEYIEIEFLGSAPRELDYEYVEPDINNKERHKRYYSTHFPNKDILFDVIIINNKGIEYVFRASGLSSGIIFINNSDISIMGEVITAIKIKSNLDHENIKLTWVSRTGK